VFFVIPTSDKTFSSYGRTFASFPPLFFGWNFDPSNADHIESVPMSLSGSFPGPKDDQSI
jgi:hypothetical protein